jgi:dTDP-glucose pyrophosphorylase/predicted transcriptional regulator
MNAERLKLFLIQQDDSIKQAMLQLTQEGIKILLILDANQKLTGTLTDGDIRRGITSGVELSTEIAEIMARNFLSVNINDMNVRQKARDLMQKHHIEYVPIIDDERKLVDIVSWHDYFTLEPSKIVHALLQNPVVIMAGGKGTRLDPFTKILPKPLIPLGEKPIVEVIMDRFYEQGFHRFKLVINHKKEMIRLYFCENKQPYEIELIEENDYCGTVGGLFLLKEKIDDTFILTNCDTLIDGDYGDFLNWHRERKNILTIVGSHKEVTVPYGVLSMTNGALTEMIEKPKYDLFVNTGTYVMEPDIFHYIGDNENIDIDKLILKLQSNMEAKVGVFPSWGRWFDIGQWDEYRNTLKSMGIDN